MDIASLLAASAARNPDRTALSFRGRPVTYAQLDESVTRTAGALAGARIGPGDRVALLLGNVPEFVYALYGTWRAGGVAVPLNVMLTPEEVGYILADAGARVVVAQMGHLPTVLAIRDRLPDLETILVVAGPPVPKGTRSFEEALSAAPRAEMPKVADDALALIQYTSGTTASPKGAMLTHANLVSNLEQTDRIEAMRVSADDVMLVVLPVFHIYALNVILGMTLRAGATAVLVERFDSADTLEAIRSQGVTILPGAPPMYGAWLRTPDAPADAFGSLRIAISGAAPLPADVAERFAKRFGVPIWDSYGLTEAGPAVATSAVGGEPRPGSIGLPLPGIEVRLVDENGEDVEEGDPGEIVVRGPNVFGGYWRKEEESREAFLDEGWLRTGDVAYRDEDGYLFLVDRVKDLIIVSGFNVFPKEVEEVLMRHPSVAEAAVIGVPDERTGEAVKASVVLKPGAEATEAGLQDYASRYLGRFKVPKQIEFVGALPKLVTGKVLRRALRGEELLGRAEGAADAEAEPEAAPG